MVWAVKPVIHVESTKCVAQAGCTCQFYFANSIS